MIRIASQPKSAAPAWHAGFLALLPTIHAYARGAFAHLNPVARQDLIQEVITNALVAYVRLCQQGRISLAYLPTACLPRYTHPGPLAIVFLKSRRQAQLSHVEAG
jgi:hypothetical protein